MDSKFGAATGLKAVGKFSGDTDGFRSISKELKQLKYLMDWLQSAS